MKALDTIRYPKLSRLERDMHERQFDDINQFRLNNNFKKIEDAIDEVEESIVRTTEEIKGEIPVMDDSVAEIGTDGLTYKYVKWDSGFCELWMTSLTTTKSVSTALGSLYSAEQTLNLPADLFTSVETCVATIESATHGYWSQVTDVSTTDIDVLVIGAESATVDLVFHAYVTGEWK